MKPATLFELYVSTICLNPIILVIAYIEPITNKVLIEKKFLKQRVKLARKIYPVGGKLSQNYIEADPVCGMKWWQMIDLCVRIAENLYDNRRLAIGQAGIYKKSTMKPFSETCVKGRVVLQTYKKKAVRVKLFKCPLSNYIFERGFELKDFYITSSSSLKKAYVLRDLYDTSPLHVGQLEDVPIMSTDGRVLFTLSEYNEMVRINTPSSESSSESDSGMDSSAMANATETIESLQNMESRDGVYFTEDGKVLVQLYALIRGLKLKRIHVRKAPQEEKTIKDTFWHRLGSRIRRFFGSARE